MVKPSVVVNLAAQAGVRYSITNPDAYADRCLCVDEKGNVITGDHIFYIYGCYMKERGKLLNNTVVTTVMSNFGLYKAFDEQGIGYANFCHGQICCPKTLESRKKPAENKQTAKAVCYLSRYSYSTVYLLCDIVLVHRLGQVT